MSSLVSQPYVPTSNGSGPSIEKSYPHGISSLSKGTTIYDALQRFGKDFEEVPLEKGSPFVKPGSVFYSFDGKRRRWDVVESHPSVAIALYHRDLHAFLMVRQFRPAVYATHLRNSKATGAAPPDFAMGFTYELCAGLIDKDKPIKQICKEEIAEEVGFDVPLEAIHPLGTAVSSAGTSGAEQAMFCAEVSSSMQRAGGGGLIHDAECIEVLVLPVEKTLDLVRDPSIPKSAGLMFGLTYSYHAVKDGALFSLQ